MKRHTFDYLIVGAGFAGSVLAERLASQLDETVLICDKRSHVGGSAHDRYDDAGILIQPYGPRVFHTASVRIFDYLSRFSEFRPCEQRVLACVDEEFVPFPINLTTLERLYRRSFTAADAESFFRGEATGLGGSPEAVNRLVLTSAEQVVVSKIGRDLYEKLFRNYMTKRWGRDPSELDASVASRVPARLDRDARYFTDEFQAMPLHGYTRLFENMLSHDNIRVMLGADYRDVAKQIQYRHLIYTGPIDAFFDHCFGVLAYRSVACEFRTFECERVLPAPVVSYPNDHGYTRIAEFKQLTGQEHPKTSVVYEFHGDGGEPRHPIPSPETAALYRRYKKLADATPGVHFVGRLATYKDYDMDQVVGQALALFDRIRFDKRQAASGRRPGAAVSRSGAPRLRPISPLGSSRRQLGGSG